MVKLRDAVSKIRTKNAGPFWLTVDIFCGDATRFEQVSKHLQTAQIAAAFAAPPTEIKRFEMPTLFAVKFSLPRPSVQGDPSDRDMHGASWATLVGSLELDEEASV